MFRKNELKERNSIRDKRDNFLVEVVKHSESDENSMKKNLYSDQLDRVIQAFFFKRVGFADKKDLIKEKIMNRIKKFMNNIADLFASINEEDYDDKVKHEIEECLSDLTLLQSKAEQDRNGLVKVSGDLLFKCIQEFNDEWLKNEIENNQNNFDKNKDKLLENYLVKWIETNLNITTEKQIVLDALIKKLKPILNSDAYLKQIINTQIINIFKELLNDLDLPKNKEIDLRKLATDLTNTSSDKEEKNYIGEKYNWVSRYGFDYEANFIDILNDTDKFKNETVSEITDSIFGNMDLVLHENNSAVIKDITRFLKTTGEFTNSEASSLAEIFVTNIRETFNECHYKGKLSNSFVVLTSEQELSNSGLKLHSNTLRKGQDAEQRSEMLVNTIQEWINDQPSDLFKANDKPNLNQYVKELATNIQVKFTNEMSEKDIKNEIRQWLRKKVIRPMRKNVDALAETLKDMIVQLQKDALNETQKKKKDNNYGSSNHHSAENINTSKQHLTEDVDDKKYDEFVTKFIQLNYNLDDDVVKEVFKLMLLEDLQKLSAPAIEELFRNSTHSEFNTDKVRMEFEIVMEVYEWLRGMPFYYSLLHPGYKIIEFVYGIARNITYVETKRIDFPDSMDYDSWLHTEIAVFMLKKEKELSNEDKLKLDHYAEQLCSRIRHLRQDDKENNDLNKVITKHMKKYESALAKDYLKKILWHRRLSEDLMKMSHENPKPSINEAEKRLSIIPIPRDESVTKFKLEIKYNIAVNDWLRGFPLMPPRDKEEELKIRNMIKELVQKIIETHRTEGCDKVDENNFEAYVADWISKLNLDPKENVEVLMMISHLKSGLDFLNWTDIQPSEIQHQNTIKRTKQHRPTELGEKMVEIIEAWSSNLPIEDDSEETKTKKEQMSTRVFQIVGTLSDKFRIANDYDSQKFKDMLSNEIDAQLHDLFGDVNEDMNSQKLNLVDKIMEIKNMIQEESAGDDYVQVLEKSIDASLGNSRRKNDPYFELLKKRIVMFWLLQNYDYAVDFISLKYKKMLTDEIDFLFEESKNIKIFLSDRHETLNEIIHVFYSAHPPDENSIIDEIEHIKLRCEIEMWAKELPLRESFNFKTLLERDQILTMLTKTLFDIERENENFADEKMKTEILKWTKKLPLLPGEKNNLSRYAELLTCLLKSSANSRKCQRKSQPTNLKIVQETLENLKRSDESNIPSPNSKNTSEECDLLNETIANLITTVVNNWCQRLPLQFCSPNEEVVVQSIKENIAQRLLQCISELNYGSSTLNNERLFNYHLNSELENLLMQLRNDAVYWEGERLKNYRKYQLIDTLRNIRQLAQNDNTHEQYRNKLIQIISNFLKTSTPYSSLKLSANTQQSILDDFMQYQHHNGDFAKQEIYKLRIAEALSNELNGQSKIDPLLATNRLICELSKVKAPVQSKINVTQSGKRRFSEPIPVKYPALNLSRQSLPFPPPPGPNRMSQSFPHPGTVYPELGSHASSNRSMPASVIRNSYQRQRAFQPLSVSLPTPTSRAPPAMQQNQTLPSLPLRDHSFRGAPGISLSNLTGLRPFPLPPPQFSISTDSSNVSSRTQQCISPHSEQARHYQQQNPSDFTMNSPHTGIGRHVCPNEPKRSTEGRNMDNRDEIQRHCETCQKKYDCIYKTALPY